MSVLLINTLKFICHNHIITLLLLNTILIGYFANDIKYFSFSYNSITIAIMLDYRMILL